eukprot:CAMPEP_0176114786 /NCGR_PEP_ID=MMETSP0120_2-20121206/57644_1 /TAXON_ID=160619 /ORGANISM="Kryptoperidinium foliaceum, Strain CCMP 1326" /LENGTH=73 /DNA_ID=CAMNT_0017449021 /DNA_START=61 /DNA_END=279 /DNA_ORIENTATION=-
MAPTQRRVFIIGDGFPGLCVARDLRTHDLATIIDVEELFGYIPDVFRACVKPKHLEALTFTPCCVIEGRMGCK